MMILLLIAVPVFAVVLGSALLLHRYLSTRHRMAIEGALRETRTPAERTLVPILKQPGKIALKGFVARFNFNRKLDALIRQAGVPWNVTGVFSVMAVGAVGGVALGIRVPVLLNPALTCAVLGGVLGMAPLLPLLVKRSKRLREFEKQLPDALDFLARAMRAGHAFSVSLKVMADESPDPLGQEFRRLCAEYNLGASLSTVLEALLARVPLIDLQFFAAAVTLQRQTGGNISEMMLRLSQVMRERSTLKGKVQAASAHGRLTGTVLTAMPACIALFLMITSPQYLGLLLKDPLGKYLIVGVIAGQIAGYLCIRKIVAFEV
jgi:tight adherence protein B